MIRPAALRHLAVQRIIVPLLIFISAALIVVGKVDQVMYEPLRAYLSDFAAPILEVLSQPTSVVVRLVEQSRAIINTYQDNIRLTEENRRLLRWQEAALAASRENAQLRDLLKLVPAAPVSYVTARVIGTSGGAYLRNLLVNAGRDNGVTRGQAAISGEGLVGRVYDVGARTARILLITDLNSRVPVVIERSRQRAILAGDNSEYPALWYLDPATAVLSGDRVITSGEGGVFPPGLPVGIVKSVDRGSPRVEPLPRLYQVGYVRIVDYGLADGLPAPVAAGSRISRRAGSAAGTRAGP